jgi:hypothetical protein
MPLVVGMSALALVATTLPALAKHMTVAAYARAQAETTQPARLYHAKHWKRGHRAARVSRRPTRPYGYAVYRGGARRSYETGLLLDCLLSQPFVICP